MKTSPRRPASKSKKKLQTNSQSKSRPESRGKSQPKSEVPRRVTHAKVQAEKKQALRNANATEKSTTKKSTIEKPSAKKTPIQSKSDVVAKAARKFNYDLDYKTLNLRKTPDLYRVGVGEQGVLLVEPYKSEILPHWKFKTPADAKKSAADITKLFKSYRDAGDLVGMDMARKFLQMGFTRSRRYANHKSGKKYGENLEVLPLEVDSEKAASAEIFLKAWKKAEADPRYNTAKADWKVRLG